jgi:chromosome segregation ATPase
MAIGYSELKDEISSIQSNISTLNREISDSESSVTRLTREKDELQSRIQSLSSTIQSQTLVQREHQNQINNVGRVQSDISGLQSHANSTTSMVQSVAAELQRLKESLDACAAVLNGETAQLRVKTSVVDRFYRKKSRQAREFQREKTAMLEATEALATAKSCVPKLLPGGSNMKFLDLKSDTKEASMSMAFESTMPKVVFRSE